MDDFVFASGIERYGSFSGWVDFFSKNWGGRVIPQGCLVLLLQIPETVFAVINAVMWMVLVTYSVKIFDFDRKCNTIFLFSFIVVAIFVFIPGGIIESTLFWKCANVLYLWGTACSFVVIHAFICELNNRRMSWLQKVAVFVCILYSSSFEQIAVFMCFILLCTLGMDTVLRKKVNYTLLSFTVICFFLSAFFILMPGNKTRLNAEILRFYQGWGMYSNLDKFFLGINYVVSGMEICIPILMVIISESLFYYIKQSGCGKLIKVASLLVVIFFSLNCVHRVGMQFDGEKDLLGKIFELYSVETTDFNIPLAASIKEIINVMAFAILGCEIILYKKGSLNVVPFLFYLGGIGTMMMMGWSPTIYASGQRPMFIGCFSLVLVLTDLVVYFCCNCKVYESHIS